MGLEMHDLGLIPGGPTWLGGAAMGAIRRAASEQLGIPADWVMIRRNPGKASIVFVWALDGEPCSPQVAEDMQAWDELAGISFLLGRDEPE